MEFWRGTIGTMSLFLRTSALGRQETGLSRTCPTLRSQDKNWRIVSYLETWALSVRCRRAHPETPENASANRCARNARVDQSVSGDRLGNQRANTERMGNPTQFPIKGPNLSASCGEARRDEMRVGQTDSTRGKASGLDHKADIS
jgi:hypothetical protein